MRAGGVAAAVRLLEARIQQVNDALALERDPAVTQQKQRLYNDVGDFLMKGFSGRHWWCSYPTLMTFMMRVLELHPGTESVRELYARMAQQLGACTKCVDLYHASLPGVRVELEFEYTDDSIKAFFHKMADLDAERIQRVFAVRPTGVDTDDRALAERVSVTLYEVLTQRRLLSDFRVLRALSKWVSSPFGSAIDRLDLNSLRNSSGLYHMLVSPDPGVRAWITTVVKRIGSIELTGETGHDQFFISALDEWMFVLETEAFNQPVMSLSLPSTDELEHFLDVTNCAKTPTAQIMWAALDTVMQQMDENSLETMLESFDNLPDLVFNSLDEADPARTNQQFITVISKCYKVLLRCLGHRFWRHTVHSPRIVLTLILDHCRNPAWREFVIKHMIELLPPLLVAMRPPQAYRQCMNDSKLKFYLKSRDELIRFLIHPEHQPPSFQSSMMSIVASNTLMTIIGDCYDHRQTRGQLEDDSTSNNGASKDDGELPESSSVDYSVAESANWWPCGGDKALETLWMSHILSVVTNPKNDASHVDHAALRCAMILRKHLQLARDALYTCIKDGGTKDGTVASVSNGKPIVTLLFERLCAIVPVTLIPVTVHGALFESIGGIAELMNSVASQPSLPAELQPFTNVLTTYENHVRVYFTSICEEVFVKGLINPLQFPIVAQHISICLLSPTADMDQPMKRMLAQMAASKGTDKLPSPMEAFLIVAHRKTEAFLRGVVSMLQTLRLYDFALPVSAPILKKIVFYWGKVFELLGNDLKKTIEGAQTQIATDHAAIAMGVSSAASMQRVPILINDFLIAILSGLYGSQDTTQVFQVDEATRIRTLEFGISFWKFWGTHLEQDGHSVSKRATFIIAPLIACLKRQGGASEKARAVQLLTIVLELLVAKRTTALDESTLRVIEGAQASVNAVDPERASTMPRIIKKLRELEKSKNFFGRQCSSDTPTLSLQPSRERKPGRAKPLSTSTVDDYFLNISNSSSASGSGLSGFSSRPMSGKAAARVQSRGATVDLTGVTAVSNQAAARKNHSFYSEDDFVPAVSTQQSSSARPSSSGARTAFNMSQLIQGMSKAHPGADRRRLQGDESSRRDQNAEENENEEEEDEDEEEEPNLQYAALYHRIKTTQKPIAVCSLLPFYRQLLQLCMPALLTYEYLNDQGSSDREHVAPGLTFSKSAEYVNAFLPLMLEECSNDVFEGLRSCSQSGGHIMRYESEKTREGMRCLNFSLVQVDEGTKTSMNFKFTNRFVPPTTDKLFRNGDIVLLRAVSNRGGASAANSDRREERQTRQKNSEFMGNREFIGVIMINENEKGKKHVSGGGKRGGKDAGPVEEDIVRILFLNDGELDSATSDRVASFEAEVLSSSALADTEWRVQPASNVVTSAREYIALRSVDLLPEHLRSTILTPNVHKSTQTEIITIAEVLDSLRSSSNTDAIKKVTKLLKRLDKLEISLTDLRSTSIGKMVNKLRKHKNEEVKQRANALKDKWTALIDQKDALERPPRFLAPELWASVRSQYNQSQLQSIHNVLNNYSVGVSLLQGPPGTGKTKTIMALLSGFLALKPPATALMPSLTSSSLKAKAPDSISPTRDGPTSSVASITQSTSGSNLSFSLGSGSSSGSILRRTDAPSTIGKRTTIQSLKNVSSVRSRLDQKLSNTSSSARPVPSSLVVRRRVISNPLGRAQAHRTNHLLLCAPSNGAVNELVLRIVTDGLLDSTGAPVKVRAPSVHADTSNCDWLSIVRLGNPGEDASEAVAGVSLPNIIKREMEIHPKTVELRALQDNQRRLRSSIKEFHQNAKERSEAGGEEGGKRTNRKELAKMHAELTSVSGKVRRLRDEVFALKAKMTETILSRASIIACTLSKAGSGPFNSLKRGFDALIIDEAAQAVELSTLVPLRERVARVVLVGDPKQLPATVKSVVAARARYDRSLFERIADSGVAPSMLRVQYRMHPFLREFPSKRFYNGLLTDGPSVMERVQRTCSRIYTSTCFQPFLLYDLPNSREEDVNGSKWNRGEAQFCVQLCETMYNMCADVRMHKWSVGFVSPYREQVNAIRRELARSSSSFSSALSIEVNTVDGFQGREKDVIIFSCVRSSHRGGIGFLRDIRRLNVAITRARFCLFVVGDVQTLVRDETWDALVRSARDRKLIIHTDGAPFPEVVKRLEGSDRGRELAEHYKEMHERVNRKAAGGESGKSDSSKDDTAKAKAGSNQPVKTGHPLDDVKSTTTKSSSIAESGINSSVNLEKKELSVNVTMENVGVPPSAADAASPIGTASTASTASADNPPTTGSNDKKKPELPEGSVEPQNSKRSGQPSDVNDRQRKLARVDSQDSEHNSKRGYTDDRSSGSRSDRSSGNRHGTSSSSGRDHSRDRSRSRGRDSRHQPRSSGDRRDFRRDHGDNNHRGDSRSRDAQPWDRNSHYGNGSSGDSYGYAGRMEGADRPRRTEERKTMPSKPPVSISAKEFCMENEPIRPTTQHKPRVPEAVQLANAVQRALGKRPFNGSSPRTPPSTASSSSNFQAGIYRDRSTRNGDGGIAPSSSSRFVGSAPNNRRVEYSSNSSRPTQHKRPSNPGRDNRGAGVLGSILGSASQLASSTSRVQDKTKRSNEF